MEYPKLETLWTRDKETFKVQHGQFKRPEFTLPRHWHITEKIDGTNVRIMLNPPCRVIPGIEVGVYYGGKTNDAQMPTFLLDYLQRAFPADRVAAAFDPDTSAVIYGEGYGPKIQKGGGLYAPDVRVRIFDVVVFGEHGRPWWLTWENVENVATKLGVATVPVIASGMELPEAMTLLTNNSLVALRESPDGPGRQQEGIVARTEPPLFTRGGQRVAWKLKSKDY